MSDFVNIIKRMTRAADVKTATQMLEKCGISQEAANNWKRNGSIPDTSIAMVVSRTGVSFNWIKTGEGEMRTDGESPLSALRKDVIGKGLPLDRELMTEAIVTICKTEEKLAIKLKPGKRAKLVLMIYDQFIAGEEIEPARVAQLVQLAS